MGKWTRRAFITAGSLVGGGLVLGVGGIVFAPNRFAMVPKGELPGGEKPLTTWIRIAPDSAITVLIPHCEMGQGAQMGLAMLLAEELDADFSRVIIEEAPAESLYANGHLIAGFIGETVTIPAWLQRALQYTSYRIADVAAMQVTGGSSSTRTTGQYGMRIAGAAARVMLLQAAARLWQVDPSECQAANSRVSHTASGRSASYGELAAAAALLPPPIDPPVKTRDQYSIVGTRQQRRDIPSKVDGSAKYGIDVVLPDLLYASIKAAPVNGGRLLSVDPAPALAMQGVRKVVQLENAVAVVATGYWQATQALKTLQPQFSLPENHVATTDELYRLHVEVLDSKKGDTDLKTGEGVAALVGASTTITPQYRVPYLAHATLEPMSATAQVVAGRCEVWAGTQDPLGARRAAAKAIAVPVEQVTLHNLPMGGGFGRRLPGCFDYVEQAVQIAKQLSPAPVKLIWSREEDMQHDYYRPPTLARFQGGLDDSGRVTTWACHYTGGGELGAARPIYNIAHKEIRTDECPGHLRAGSWRSVASSAHGFFMESFIDELAVAAGKDPYEYRSLMLDHQPRHLQVLDKVAALANWHDPLPAGRARGIAIVDAFETIIAQVAEVSVTADGKIRVHNIYAAVDCGLVVNPDQALAQVEGGILFGLCAALNHEITLRDGAVEQRSFPDYPMLKLAEAPRVQVVFMESSAKMGGLGEPGVPPVAPAVANAVFALTGKRLRTLPLRYRQD